MSSIASLQRRVDKLRLEVERRKARAADFTSAVNATSLPGRENWPDFARRTWIRTAGTIAPFDPYDFQIELVRDIEANQNVIVNKSRQMGASETVASYLACRAATEPGFAAVVISKTQQDSADLGRRTRRMLNSMQGHSFRYTSDSNMLVSLVGGGTLYFLPGSARAARGIPSGSVLWIDEAAFVDGAEEIYRAAAPALSMLGDAAKVIVTSTPDTEVDWFGGIWHDGAPSDWYDYVESRRLNELNDRLSLINDSWCRIAIHYSQHPVYSADPKWAEQTRKKRKMTQSAWDSEYELAFGSNDSQVFPTALVDSCSIGAFRECGVIRRDYIMGIDPNAGGSDYFVAVVMDITAGSPPEVVALYRQNGRSTEYSLKRVQSLIEDFMPSKTIVEKNGMGQVIAEALALENPKYQIETFVTSRPSKTTATDRILYLMENNRLIFPPGIIPAELKAFRQDDTGTREAAPGHHDDCVMALAFACSLIPETPSTAGFFAHI